MYTRSLANETFFMMIGYACINTELKSNGIRTNRGLIKRTYEKKGLPYVSELVSQNTQDLISHIEWNIEHEVGFFRMSSSIFPFIEWYEFEDLPDWEDTIRPNLERVGELAEKHNQRITQHPDHFVKLASKGNQELVDKSVRTLTQQAKIFDVMGLEQSVYNSLNIHIGGAYGNKEKTARRFCDTYRSLPESVSSRLTVENDDKQSMYTVGDLYDMVHSEIGIPIVFDSLHYECHPGDMTYNQALEIAIGTWTHVGDGGIRPIVHHSESRQLFEDSDSRINAHTDFYYTAFVNETKTQVDVMLESKMKERARDRYIRELT